MSWLVRVLLNEADRRAVENDLAELYELRRRQDGDRAAARWLRRQHLLYPLHYFLDGARAAVSDWRALMRHLWRDTVYSLRSLARTPALTTTIVLTVGIGLGATTAMIRVVRGVLVNPLPYAAPDNLFWLYTDAHPFRFRFSVVDYRALEADHPAFSDVAAYQSSSVTVSEGGLAERVTAKSVTGSYFPLMGQRAAIGRLFDPSDDTRGDRVAVLTAAYWTRRFGGDPSVLGRSLVLDGTSHTIVGVLENSDGPLERNVAVFTAARWAPPTRKGPFFTNVLGRLRPGVSQAAAAETLHATNARLFPIWKSSYQDEKATWGLLELKTRVVGDIGATLFVALAAVGCVLLIACANAINLLVARALARSRELAIRSALGASRGRLLQHLVAESAVLCAGAAATGAAVAWLGLRLVASYGTDYIPRVDEIGMSASMFGWLAGLTAGSGALIFAGGLFPVIRGSSIRVERALRSGNRSSSDGPASRRFRRALVAAEFALATPLVVAAVLVTASLDRLNRVSVGVDTGRLLTASVSLFGPAYAGEAERKAFWDRALERIAAVPGVEAAALADGRPPNEPGQHNNFDLEDHPATAGRGSAGLPMGRRVARLLQGIGPAPRARPLVRREVRAGRLRRRRPRLGGSVLPGPGSRRPPVQERRMHVLRLDDGRRRGQFGEMGWAGVEGSGHGLFPFHRSAERLLCPPHGRRPGVGHAGAAASRQGTGSRAGPDGRRDRRDARVGFALVAALSDRSRGHVRDHRAGAVARRHLRRDGALRPAAHARHRHPARARRRTVARAADGDVEGLRVVAVGVAFGVGAAFLTARLLTTLLFGVRPTDPATMAGVPLALLATAAVACLVPGLRAARVDPAEILREA